MMWTASRAVTGSNMVHDIDGDARSSMARPEAQRHAHRGGWRAYVSSSIRSRTSRGWNQKPAGRERREQ